MKQLVSKNGAIFGPFNEFVKLDDRYCADGVLDIAFTVVGDDCEIQDWVKPVEPEVIDAPVQP